MEGSSFERVQESLQAQFIKTAGSEELKEGYHFWDLCGMAATAKNGTREAKHFQLSLNALLVTPASRWDLGTSWNQRPYSDFRDHFSIRKQIFWRVDFMALYSAEIPVLPSPQSQICSSCPAQIYPPPKKNPLLVARKQYTLFQNELSWITALLKVIHGFIKDICKQQGQMPRIQELQGITYQEKGSVDYATVYR